jgi:hypothetical protein
MPVDFSSQLQLCSLCEHNFLGVTLYEGLGSLKPKFHRQQSSWNRSFGLRMMESNAFRG